MLNFSSLPKIVARLLGTERDLQYLRRRKPRFMEQKETILFDKDRSINACVSDAWRLIAIHWKSYLRATIIPALLVGSSGALLTILATNYACTQALPAYRLFESGEKAELVKFVATPAWDTAFMLLLALIFFLVSIGLFGGRTMHLMANYRCRQDFRDIPTWHLTAADRHHCRRFAVTDISLTLLTLLLMGCIVWAAAKWSVFIAFLLPLLLIFSLSMAHIAHTEASLFKQPFVASLRLGFRKSFGHAFIVQLITAIPTLLFCIVCLLPMAVYSLTALAAADSTLMGDTPTMPNALPVLYFVFMTFSFALIPLGKTIGHWALAMILRPSTK